MIYLIVLLLIVITVWVIGLFKTNDFKISTKNISKYQKILIIFPHPDDESLSVSGLVQTAKKLGKNITLLVLTKGEKGEAYKCSLEDLGEIRKKEMEKSAKIIGVSNLIQLDFPDGKLKQKKSEILKYLDNQIKISDPDLVITYDLSGLYGHEDHIVVSEIVTNLIKEKYIKTALWYISYPYKVLDMISLPTHMAKNKDFLTKRMAPSLKIFVGFYFIYSYLSVMAHHSQHKSFRNEELWFVPLWFAYSTQIFEYFYEAN
jgi:LmbE family N-acetylglucosaminyl deacetylase